MLGLGSCLQDLPGYRNVHLYLSVPTHCVQNSSITLPADSRLTALVPSESAIRRLSLEDQAFWLQPKMLPELVRWGQLGRALEGILGRTLDPSQTRLGESGFLFTVSPQKCESPC